MSLLFLAPCGSDTTARDTAHHRALNQFKPIDLAFRLTVRPFVCQCCSHRGLIVPHISGELTRLWELACLGIRHPRIKCVVLPTTNHGAVALTQHQELLDVAVQGAHLVEGEPLFMGAFLSSSEDKRDAFTRRKWPLPSKFW